MKTQQAKLQRTKPFPANNRSSNQAVTNSQTPKNFQKRNHNSTPIDSDVETFTETCNLTTNLPLLPQTPDSPTRNANERKKLRINRLKTAQTATNFKNSIKSSNEWWKTRNHRTKARTNGGKWLHQHTTTQKLQKLQELTLWMGTGFTRPHGGRLMILSVDQSARILPRQRYLPLDRLSTALASVLHTSILLKNLQKTEWRRWGRSRSDAQVSDGITKTLREKS